jgi:hypothetical protein
MLLLLCKVQTVMEVTIIGHGSLMSGRGLAFSGALHVKDAYIVALAACQRGFAKLSRYGDRFATDLMITRAPLEGRRIAPGSSPTLDIEGLALTVPLEDAARLSTREGYDPTRLQQLADIARTRGLGVAEFLWRLQVEAGANVVAYRRQLFALIGYTSPHYIPHPVHLDAAHYALIFLAPGFEGTGADEVISIRQQTGVAALMNTVETWRRKPNPDQLSYFLSCLLGGVHGVSVRDLLHTVSEEPMLRERLVDQLSSLLRQEREQFLSATGLTTEQYQHAFGEPTTAMERSGLRRFLQEAKT